MQCINTKCLHKNSEGATHCEVCGSQLIVNNRLRTVKIISEANLFSPPEVKTFEAVDVETQEKVILRVVQSENPGLIASLQEAVLALRQVHLVGDCPGIMRLSSQEGYFVWQILPDEPESHFMASQKVEGIPLDVWINQNKPIDEQTATNWLRQLILSADALHQEGFVHQDIKPSNIIYREADSQLVLIDLGAIRYIDSRQSLNADIQQGLQPYPVIGTPGYQSAEQTAGRPTPASDYFSIGRTLIHLLTGVHPLDLPISATGKLRWRDLTQISSSLAELIDRLTQPSSAQDILNSLSDLTAASDADKGAQKNDWVRSRIVKIAALLIAIVSVPLAVGTSTALSSLQAQSDANRLFSQGNQLISTGTPSQAVPILERAAEIAPEDADIRATLAFAYALSGNINTAVDSYDIALKLSPNNPFIRYNLANIYEQVDPQRAVANYQIAAQEDSPIKEDALNNLARVYIMERELEKANELLKKTSSQNDLTQAVLYKNRGWLEFEQGNFEQASMLLNESIDFDPTRADAYCLISIIKMQQGQPSKDDEITCLSLPTPRDRPEVSDWKHQLIQRSSSGLNAN